MQHNVLPSKPKSAKWSPAIRFLTENSICCFYLFCAWLMPHTSQPSWLNLRCTTKIGMIVCVFSYQYFVCLPFRTEQETSSSVTVVRGTWLCWGFFQGIF
jgi:hypothetical protein